MKYIFEGDEEWIKATVPYTSELVGHFGDIKGIGEKKGIISAFGSVRVILYKQKGSYIFKQDVMEKD